jgi:hypothetical protein
MEKSFRRASDIVPSPHTLRPNVLEPDRRPSWPELVEHEPALLDLLEFVRSFKPEQRVGADGEAFTYFCAPSTLVHWKRKLARLVGWSAPTDDPFLRTRGAYVVGYSVLFAALPDCENCSCLSLADVTP